MLAYLEIVATRYKVGRLYRPSLLLQPPGLSFIMQEALPESESDRRTIIKPVIQHFEQEYKYRCPVVY